MSIILEYWPLLLPYIIIQLTLMTIALVHVLKYPHYRFGNKTMWILIVILLQMIGPIVYFVFGRGEER